MKFIFDFDDVLFHTTRHRKEHMFILLQKAGISEDRINEYYQKARITGFSLRKMLAHFFRAKKSRQEKLYEDIMSEYENFANKELMEFIKKLGQENCFLVTHGGTEFQSDKIKRVAASKLFTEMFILIGSKKEIIENICKKFQNEKVIFIDDKAKYFEDLDFVKYPKLKTVLYDANGLKKLKAEIAS